MTDYHGLAPLPAVSRGAEPVDPADTSPAITDPGIVVLADFLKAVLVAELDDAFTTDFPVEDSVCRKAYPHDPREDLLEANWLPSLFCWRGSVTPQRFEDGYRGSTSTIMCLWVFPPADEVLGTQMAPIANGVAAALTKALLELDGRHPAWVVDGDTDPYSATYGSSLLDQGGFWIVEPEDDIKFTEVSIGTQQMSGLLWQIATRENHVPGTQSGLGTQIQTVINEPGDDPVFVQTTVRTAS
jgi:hypothetical protein